MKRIHYLLGLMLLMAGYTSNVSAQVSNDNEDAVNKITEQGISWFLLTVISWMRNVLIR